MAQCTGLCGKEMPENTPRCEECQQGAAILNALAARGRSERDRELALVIAYLRGLTHYRGVLGEVANELERLEHRPKKG